MLVIIPVLDTVLLVHLLACIASLPVALHIRLTAAVLITIVTAAVVCLCAWLWGGSFAGVGIGVAQHAWVGNRNYFPTKRKASKESSTGLRVSTNCFFISIGTHSSYPNLVVPVLKVVVFRIVRVLFTGFVLEEFINPTTFARPARVWVSNRSSLPKLQESN